MSKLIPLTKHKFALVDDADFQNLSLYNWWYKGDKKTGYAVRWKKGRDKNGKRRLIWMHRVIVGAKEWEMVDHMDRNGLNNERSNLRIVDISQSNQNRQTPSFCSIRYLGVTYIKRLSKYRARIGKNGKRYHLGLFLTAEEAAQAYNKKAIELYGPLAAINEFP